MRGPLIAIRKRGGSVLANDAMQPGFNVLGCHIHVFPKSFLPENGGNKNYPSSGILNIGVDQQPSRFVPRYQGQCQLPEDPE